MHELVRPAWGPDGTFLYAMPSKPGMHMSRKGRASNRGNALIENRTVLVSEGKDVRFARLNVNNVRIVLAQRFRGSLFVC